MIRVINASSRYVDQGGGKRAGAVALYIEPWHGDIQEFLELKLNHGAEESRARDIHLALWIPDLFMERVKQGALWSLFCPDTCPLLLNTYGDEFEKAYVQYEKDGKALKQVPARTIMDAILKSQMETGNPYMLYKDSINRKSNHKHLGMIRSSNLCTEIVQYTSKDEVAVCNLMSIVLPSYVNVATRTFDFKELIRVTGIATKTLNKIIDLNDYPIKEARNSNMRHRPIGIGVQGLADVFQMLRYPFESAKAKAMNIDIFEAMYYGALRASSDLARIHGPYESYEGSPISQGILQFDMWGITPSGLGGLLDWEGLRADIRTYGVRNSLLIAPMPTKSSSAGLGYSQGCEPNASMIGVEKVNGGEFVVVNRHLITDLIRLGIWNDTMKHRILANRGSVQGIEAIPANIQELYKTAWEIDQNVLLQYSIDRAPFIDQSQSFSLFMRNLTRQSLLSLHMRGWKKGAKTGMYYLHTDAAVSAAAVAVPLEILKEQQERSAPVAPITSKLQVKIPPVRSESHEDDDNIGTINRIQHEDPAAVGSMSPTPDELQHMRLLCSVNNPDSCEMCSA
jgi:ribonucleoside-diphosphate reductase alpha subunit